MVSLRCKMVLKVNPSNLCLHYVNVSLGEVEKMENLTQNYNYNLKETLQRSGLKLMND